MKDLTIQQYQKIYSISKTNMMEIDKMVQIVAAISNLTIDEVENLDIKVFKDLVNNAHQVLQGTGIPEKPKRKIVVSGKTYVIIYNPRKFQTWQAHKLNQLTRGDVIENLHKLAALICRPVVRRLRIFNFTQKVKPSEFDSLSETMLEANFNDLNNACSYFIKLWNASIKVMAPVIQRELEKQPTILKEEAEYLAASAVHKAQIT